MIKEFAMIALIIFMVLLSPYIGTILSFVGVLTLTVSPIVVLMIFITPSIRTRFLSA